MNNDNIFNSIEKLMELGMSMTIAQQMMKTMNHALHNMTTPQFSNTDVPLPNSSYFFALVNEIPQGPFTNNELFNYIQTNSITKETLIWTTGMIGWMKAESVPEVAKLFVLPPPNLG
jgi:hypothetical protein